MSAFASVNNPGSTPVPEVPARPTYKSFKKKFLKLRHNFRERMRESNILYDEERRANAIARRLQEQNDQLLDVLLNVNDSTKIPSYLHYNLRSPTPDASAVPELSPEQAHDTAQEFESAQAALQEARRESLSGNADIVAYKDVEATVDAIASQSQSLANLARLSHSSLQSVPIQLIPSDLTDESPTGYLCPSREEEFLQDFDNYLDNSPPDADPLPPRPPRLTDREREKDAQLHNPMSVFNWLLNHRPKELSDDDSNHPPEKSSKILRKTSPKTAQGGANRPSKRERSSVAAPRQEDEMVDEDAIAMGGPPGDMGGTQRKRKRGGEDEAYRPKGGGSKKRKRQGISGGLTTKKVDLEEEGT